jgi:hypothetical protein
MLTHPTLSRLVTLGLTGMAKAFDEQQQQPDIAALGFEARLQGLRRDRPVTPSSLAPRTRRWSLPVVKRQQVYLRPSSWFDTKAPDCYRQMKKSQAARSPRRGVLGLACVDRRFPISGGVEPDILLRAGCAGIPRFVRGDRRAREQTRTNIIEPVGCEIAPRAFLDMIANRDALRLVASAFVRKQRMSSAIAIDGENQDAVVGQEPRQFMRPAFLLLNRQVGAHRNGEDDVKESTVKGEWRGKGVLHKFDTGKCGCAPGYALVIIVCAEQFRFRRQQAW